jgi:Glucosidase II beta subunit-like protein
LLAQEQERAQIVKRYTLGSKQRETMLAKYQAYVQEMKTKLKQYSHDLQQKQTQLTKQEREYKVASKQYTVRHIERILHEMNVLLGHDGSAAKSMFHCFNDLSIAELEQLIVHACQMIGEMVLEGQTSPFHPYWGSRKTCVPLRMAALEMGDMWEMNEEKQYLELRRLSLLDENDALILLLADMYFYNTGIEDTATTPPIWNEADWKSLKSGATKKKTPSKRYHRGEDDYETDDYEEDYIVEEDSSSEVDAARNSADGITEVRELIHPAIQYSSFSEPRRQFVSRVNDLLPLFTEWIQEIERTVEDETEGEEAGGNDALHSLPVTRALLEARVAAIDHGYETAVSARILLDLITIESLIFLEDERFIDNTKDSKNEKSSFHKHYLQKLLIGTIFYGRLSALHLYELFVATLATDDGGDAEPESSEQPTCPSPLSHLCPSRSSLEHLNVVTSIPSSIVEAVDGFCSQLSDDAGMVDTCGVSSDSPPSSVSDGYLGYYPVYPRGEDDSLNSLMYKLGSDEIVCSDNEKWARKEIATLKATVEQTEATISSIEGKISEIQESVGDPNDAEASKYGIDGELYSIRDECFSITQGKYKYEVCMFQGATQNDVSNGDSGTSLGTWTGSSMETNHDASIDGIEYEQRIWKWENGAQCWNGPQRSVTAHLTCGVETKVLSADEPDTCRYVLEMESPVACDGSFKILHRI